MPAKPVELRDARVLVLGGSGVLGSSIAAELTRRGAKVVLAGRNEDKLRERASALGDAPTIVFDMMVPADGRRVVEEAVEALGSLDGIVNAAGVVAFGPFAELTDQTLEELVIVDLMAPLRIIRTALPHLENGFVLNLTGVVAESPVAGLVTYSAVKSALSAAAKGLTRELRRSNIHFLDARPPHTETSLAERAIAGTAPRMPEGLDPDAVARVVIDGLANGHRELAASALPADPTLTERQTSTPTPGEGAHIGIGERNSAGCRNRCHTSGVGGSGQRVDFVATGRLLGFQRHHPAECESDGRPGGGDE